MTSSARLLLALLMLATAGAGDNYVRWQQTGAGLELGAGDGVIGLAAGSNGMVYAAVDKAGLFRSTDGGATWSRLPGVPSTSAVAISPVDPKVALTAAAGDGKGLSQTIDGGTTWTQVAGLASEDVDSIFFSDDGQTVLVGHRAGTRLSASSDGGNSWKPVELGAEVRSQYPLAIDAKRWVVASLAGNVVRCTGDAGATWTVGAGATEYFAGRLPMIRVGGTLLSSKHHGTSKSVDGGASWTYAMEQHARVIGSAGEFAFREGDRQFIRGTKDRILNLQLSDDLGGSWKPITCGLIQAIPAALRPTVIIPAATDPYAHTRLATAWAGAPDQRTVYLALGRAGLYRGQLCWSKGGPIIGQPGLAPLSLIEGDVRTSVSLRVVAAGRKAAVKRVTADLAQVGGTELELYDDGQHDDGAAGDKTFANAFQVGKGVTAGDRVIGVIAEDEKGGLSSAVAQLAIASASDTFTVWDGDQYGKGLSWVAPKTELNSLKTQTDEQHNGKVALELHGDGGGHIGGGWNWHGWYPEGSGDDIRKFRNLSLWMKIDCQGELGTLSLSLNSSNKGASGNVDVLTYCPEAKDGAWHEVVIPLADLAQKAKDFNPAKVWEIDINSWSPHPRVFSVYIDQIGFDNRPVRALSVMVSAPEDRQPTPLGADAVEVSASVDLAAAGVPISPYIYGVAMGDTTVAREMGATIRRSGGNPLSPMNWKRGFSSHGADWCFANNGQETPPEQNWVMTFHGASAKEGFASYVSLPLMGRVAKDGTSAAFDINKYPDQETWAGKMQPTDPHPNAGNGRQRVKDGNGGFKKDEKGNPVYQDIVPDPDDTSLPMTVEEQCEAYRYMVEKLGYGTADKGGIRFLALDNEPCLWSSTHRGMHPLGTSYDELWDKTLRAGTYIKGIDPQVKIAGPTFWGWTAYFVSGLDAQLVNQGKCTWEEPSDFAAHGKVPWALWYLKQVAAHKQKTGLQLIDILDFHFYPQNGIYMGGVRNDPTWMEKRVQETRVMWDTDFVDPTWMGRGKLELPHLVTGKPGVIAVIKLMRKWIKEAGLEGQMGLSFGEYNFGGEEDVSGGVAQSELFGIFAREQVDHAYYWLQPAMNSSTYFAWKMFRNPDGRNTTWGDRYLPSAVSAKDDVSVHAARDSASKRISLILVNKRAGKGARLTIKLSQKIPAQQVIPWEYSAADSHCIGLLPPLQAGGDSLRIDLPPMSVIRVDLKP